MIRLSFIAISASQFLIGLFYERDLTREAWAEWEYFCYSSRTGPCCVLHLSSVCILGTAFLSGQLKSSQTDDSEQADPQLPSVPIILAEQSAEKLYRVCSPVGNVGRVIVRAWWKFGCEYFRYS